MPLLPVTQTEVDGLERTYQSIIRDFVRHVDETEGLTTHQGEYATRANIRSYFKVVVRHKSSINKAGASKRRPALQALVSAEDGASKDFIIGTDQEVKRSLQLHAKDWKSKCKDTAGDADPHDNLQHNVPSFEDINDVLRECEDRATKGTQLAVSFLCGSNAMLRGGSQRGFVVGDLGIEDGIFGPPTATDPNKRYSMMYLCLAKGTGKDAASVTRVTGSWRHIRVREDFSGWMALHLFNVFSIQLQKLDFSSAESPNSIRKVALLISWADTASGAASQREAYQALFEKLDKKFAKVTHMRSAAVQLAGAQGATPADVAGLSKHEVHKLAKTYWCDLPPRSLAILAGVLGDFWGYYVPRWFIPYQANITDLLFPARPSWVAQQRDGGDTGTRATIFLNKVLPFMARLLWQDAVWCRCTPGLTDNIRVVWVRSKYKLSPQIAPWQPTRTLAGRALTCFNITGLCFVTGKVPNFDTLAAEAYAKMQEVEKTMVRRSATASSSQGANVVAAHVSGLGAGQAELRTEVAAIKQQGKEDRALMLELIKETRASRVDARESRALLAHLVRTSSPVHGAPSASSSSSSSSTAAAAATTTTTTTTTTTAAAAPPRSREGWIRQRCSASCTRHRLQLWELRHRRSRGARPSSCPASRPRSSRGRRFRTRCPRRYFPSSSSTSTATWRSMCTPRRRTGSQQQSARRTRSGSTSTPRSRRTWRPLPADFQRTPRSATR